MEIVKKDDEGTPHVEVKLPSDEDIIAGEIEMLDGMIEEMASKVGEATVALRKLEIIRGALQNQEGGYQFELPLEEEN
tara:strand:+ start:256 stop:489 length:234 start_codon:yes stop_codon:yes gene_type:complete